MQATRMRVAAATALVVVSLTAGCIGGLSADGSVDANAVGDAVEQRYAALNGYDATVTRTVEVGDSTTAARANVTVRGDRREVTYSAGPRAGETMAGTTDSGPVLGTGVATDTPATPAGYGALAESLVRTSDVSVERVTTYDGHRTAVVELDPQENATGDGTNVSRTVWVDLDREIPLQVVTSWTTDDGQSASVTVTYDDVTLVRNESANAEVAA
ncbi:hypothetical protein [Halobacterium noricense]|uniref:hypothetical protein n=1 Tax=Halobacterium noricense TaxID=223182 RepID=UPI001E2B862F|nr:hypothetical protein [Halobacterium noricense]UHH26015.1 hypothetical protein LT974_03545 [Halobacterium noricense]